MAAICVFCSGKVDLAEQYLDVARRLGAQIAARGHALVFGGGGTGMMGAVADAARAGGAAMVGVIPESLTAREQADASSELIVTPDLGTRKAVMIEKSDVFLVLPGGLGTLDELFEVWTTGPQLKLHGKPIVVVNEGGFYDGLLAWLREVAARGVIHRHLVEAVVVASSVEEALDAVTG